MTPKPEPLISSYPEFSELLEQAVVMSEHILNEVDTDDVDNANVTLNAGFVLDMMTTLVEFAERYEAFESEEIVGMYNFTRENAIVLANRTKH